MNFRCVKNPDDLAITRTDFTSPVQQTLLAGFCRVAAQTVDTLYHIRDAQLLATHAAAREY
jgi:hypothetical protein